MADEHAATGPKGESIAAIDLSGVRRGAVDRSVRCRQRTAYREPADPLGSHQVALQQRRRDFQHASDVVEAVTRIVGRQQAHNIDVQAQQIPDRVAILDPVEAVEDLGATRVRMLCRGAIELRFKPRAKSLIGDRIRSRPTQGRHQPGAELAHHLFPRLRMVGHARQVKAVKRQVASPGPLVVTAAAVGRDKRAVGSNGSGAVTTGIALRGGADGIGEVLGGGRRNIEATDRNDGHQEGLRK